MLVFSKVSILNKSFVVSAFVFLLHQSCVYAQEKSETAEKLKSFHTVAEKSNYLATAGEQDVLKFLLELDESSPFASQFQIGSTTEGRPIQA